MKLSRIFQVPLLSGVLTLAQVQIWNDGSSVSVEDVVPSSEEEEEKLKEWYSFLDSHRNLKIDTLTHLHSDQDFIQENKNRARAAGMLYRSLQNRDKGVIRDDHPFAAHVRKLKDKTGDMFVPTSKSLSKTKSPKGCKSTKSPSKESNEEPTVACGESLQPSSAPSQSALPSNLPSISPSDSGMPSSAPSEEPSISAMPSYGVPDGCSLANTTTKFCFEGNASYVKEKCSETGSNCCRGSSACSFSNATVCSGSCNGQNACFGLPDGAYIARGSCSSDGACYNAGGMADGLMMGRYSCNCEYACDELGLEAFGQVVNVGFRSCNGVEACISTLTDSLGSGSCNGENACDGLYAAFIGPKSCNGYQACYRVGSYSAPANVSIGSGSCNNDRACQGFANNESLVDAIVSIGDNACTDPMVASQCSGDVATGGSATCRDASGSYGSNLPDNAVGCG